MFASQEAASSMIAEELCDRGELEEAHIDIPKPAGWNFLLRQLTLGLCARVEFPPPGNLLTVGQGINRAS